MQTRIALSLLTAAALIVAGPMVMGKKPGGGGGGGSSCDGSPIEVLNEDPFCGESKWIGATDSATVCHIICNTDNRNTRKCDVSAMWIGGTVVADPSAEHGFYFDANTVRVAEITAEGQQTDICQIAANPDFYDGGTWFVPADFQEYRDL